MSPLVLLQIVLNYTHRLRGWQTGASRSLVSRSDTHRQFQQIVLSISLVSARFEIPRGVWDKDLLGDVDARALVRQILEQRVERLELAEMDIETHNAPSVRSESNDEFSEIFANAAERKISTGRGNTVSRSINSSSSILSFSDSANSLSGSLPWLLYAVSTSVEPLWATGGEVIVPKMAIADLEIH
ncbi:MAG: hypothetical protein M1840_003851 [Geoglossum simile]|nr:MAG: hypothetical protein M1840_003851 [Geoglossum simile]